MIEMILVRGEAALTYLPRGAKALGLSIVLCDSHKPDTIHPKL